MFDTHTFPSENQFARFKSKTPLSLYDTDICSVLLKQRRFLRLKQLQIILKAVDCLQPINLKKAERPGVKFLRTLWIFGILNFEFGRSVESNSNDFAKSRPETVVRCYSFWEFIVTRLAIFVCKVTENSTYGYSSTVYRRKPMYISV